MIDIKDIQGNIILSVPVTESAQKVEELMSNDYIQLSWNSDSSDSISLGSYIEYEGERYSLIEPYTPSQKNEVEFVYTPQFKSRVMAWGKKPFFFYSGESREPDWALTSNPADFMRCVCDAILEETGESWSYSIDASLPASASLSFTSVDILSGLNQIAGAFETEWFADKSTNTIYLGLLSHGEEVTLEVGKNINVPSVQGSKEGYYTRFYAFGSTRNITQDYEGSNINNLVNKRLTLDPTRYPNGYKDIMEGLSEGEIFPKVLIFDDVYPSANLSISGVRNRLMYRLDTNGDKIQIGTDEDGTPIYDQYAIWYFRIEGFNFDLSNIIEGYNLSVSFQSGALQLREFELKYYEQDTTITTSDGLKFEAKAGDYEILFIEEGSYIIPSMTGLVPSDGDSVILFNIKMPSEYTQSAYTQLEEELDKEIARMSSDLNNYTFKSNPIAFNDNNPNLSIGRSVRFVNGNYTYNTRVIKLTTHLDFPIEQEITIGNQKVKGNTQQLKEEVASANKDLNLLAVFNDMTQSIQQSYNRTQQMMLEGFAAIKNIWQLRETESGEKYAWSAFNVVTQQGITMYANNTTLDLPSIYAGLPVDNTSIYWEDVTDEEGNVIDRVLKAKIGSGEGGSATLLGDLENVGAWANATATEDRIMVQKKDSTAWTSLLLSEIKGTADFSNVKESGEGNAFTSFTLSEDKKTLTFLKGETFAKSSDLALKWTQDDTKISNWDAAFGWGDHSKQGYTTKTYVDGKFLPLDGGTVTGNLRLRTGSEYTSPFLYFGDSDEVYLKEATDRYLTIHADKGIILDSPLTTIDGIEIKKSADGVLYIDANLVVSGGITMYGTDGTTSSSIWDGAPIASTSVKGIASFDSEFFAVNNGKVTFIGETGGGASSWDDLEGKPSWIGSTKPSYTFSEIGSKPTTLSGYGITDAKISNGVITLGANTITPLTAHQAIYNLTFQAGTFSAKTFDPNGAAQTVNIPTKTSHLVNDSNFITSSYVDGTFVTIAGSENVTGIHNFTNGLKIGGIKVSKSQDGVIYLEGNLVVSGGVTMFGTDSVTASTVMDGVMVDGTTIRKNPTTGKLEVIGGTGGGLDENALANYLTTNKYLTQTTGDTRYVTALGINGNNLTWTKNGTVNNITVPYATTAKELTSYSAITFSKSDNSGKPCYLLIADVTSWYNVSSGATAYGVAGFVYGYRNGATPAYSMNIAARCAYGKGYYSLNSSLKSIIEPRVVSYNSKYYLALYLQGSNRTFNFIGRKDNLLSSFTELQCSDGNGTYSGLSVIYKGSATGTSSKADSLSTSRTISLTGHATGSGSFDGSEDLGISIDIPTRNVYINGTGYTVHSTITTDITGIYAPTSGGISGYVLKANGTTSIPTWVAQSSLSVGTASKLSTERTIWGQSFNGTANVSGNLSGVGSISMSGSINYNDYTIFSYSVSTGNGGASTGASLLGSPSLATTLRSSGNDLYHWNAANSAKYLIFDTNNFTNYTNKALTKKNSGTNLLTDGDKYIGAQAYLMGYYTYDSSVTNGVKYRCTLCGKLGDNNTHIVAYWDGGSGNNTTISGLSSTEERTITFTATITNKQRLAFYQFPNGKFGSYIKWCKLEVEEDVTGDTSTYLYNIDRIDFANDSNSHNFGLDRNGTVYGYNAGVLKLRRGISSGGSFVQYEANNQTVYGWRAGADNGYKFSWWYYNTSSGTDEQRMYLDSSGNLLATGGITMYGSSDKRLKKNIRTFQAGKVLMSLGGVYQFEYEDDEINRNGMYKGTHVGLIYQNVKGTILDKMCYEREDGYGALNYLDSSFISLLAGVGVEHETRIQRLERENEELRKEIEQLKTA